MIAGLLRVFIKLVVATGIVALSLTLAGDYLRKQVPEPYQPAVWQTGMLIFFSCIAAGAVMTRSRPAKQRKFENLLLAGAATGALLFLLFITDLECFSTQSGHGSHVRCRYLGES